MDLRKSPKSVSDRTEEPGVSVGVADEHEDECLQEIIIVSPRSLPEIRCTEQQKQEVRLNEILLPVVMKRDLLQGRW